MITRVFDRSARRIFLRLPVFSLTAFCLGVSSTSASLLIWENEFSDNTNRQGTGGSATVKDVQIDIIGNNTPAGPAESSSYLVKTGTFGGHGGLLQTGLNTTTSNESQGGNATITFEFEPRLTISKKTNHAANSFTIAGTNGWDGQILTTAAQGRAVASTTQFLENSSTVTMITETQPPHYQWHSVTCDGLGAGGTIFAKLSRQHSHSEYPTQFLENSSTGAMITETRPPHYQWHTVTCDGLGAGGTIFAKLSRQHSHWGCPTQFLENSSTGTMITETRPPHYQWHTVTCDGLGAGGTMLQNCSASILTADAGAAAEGSNIHPTFTNTAFAKFSLAKSTTMTDFSVAGEIIPVNFVVTDADSTTFTEDITVSDDNLVSVSCPSVGAGLASGNSITCMGNNILLQTDPDAGSPVNTASATSGSTASPSHKHILSGVFNPSLTVAKIADDDHYRKLGDEVVYSYTVTNTGNVTVSDVTLDDSAYQGGEPSPLPWSEMLSNDVAPMGDSTDAATNGVWDKLAPGDSIIFTGTYTLIQADIKRLQ